MGVDQGAIRLPKAAELVAANLRRRIVTGQLQEGDALPSEASLVQQFQVSRASLREAFRILESESLIRVFRGARGGARVQVPNDEVAARYAGYVLEYRSTPLSDVFAARNELESPLARILAAGASPEQVERLEVAVSSADPTIAAPSEFEAHETRFHHLLAELSGNRTLIILIGMLDHIAGPARAPRPVDIEPCDVLAAYTRHHASHVTLVRLIAAHRPDAAEEVWSTHLRDLSLAFLALPLAARSVDMTPS